LVDQVLSFEESNTIVCTKAVGIGEPSLKGHFPGFPIFPGVLLVEALGQSSALLLELTNRNWKPGYNFDKEKLDAKLGVLAGVKIDFKSPVFPGALVHLKAEIDWSMGPVSKMKVVAYSGDVVFARGSITVAMVEKTKLLPVSEAVTELETSMN
jgi:3-hydroxyacyl-[acyl-carrier-protein] dehydratase